MYCSYCGCKLDGNAKKCPACGNDAKAEYCGGFWGLVGETRQQVHNQTLEISNKEEKTVPLKSKTDEVSTNLAKEKVALEKKIEKLKKKEKNNQLKQKIFIGLIVFVLLICTIQTIRLAFSNKKIAKLQNENETISRKYDDLLQDKTDVDTDYKDLKEKYDELDQSNSELQGQYDELNESYQLLEEAQNNPEDEISNDEVLDQAGEDDGEYTDENSNNDTDEVPADTDVRVDDYPYVPPVGIITYGMQGYGGV